MSVCTQAKEAGEIVPFTEELKKQALELADDLNEDGLRVLAVGLQRSPFGKE